VTVHPLLLAGVPLVLATIIYERFLLERQVLHYAVRTYQSIDQSINPAFSKLPK